MHLAATLRQLEADAPRLYSRWSEAAWRAACQGPALALFEKLDGDLTGFDSYLSLLREAVGLQYVSTQSEANPDESFLTAILFGTLPRLLPDTPPKSRAALLADLWNVGEKLASRPVWLNRYLAIRLRELTPGASLAAFLERALEEGLSGETKSFWKPPFVAVPLDPSRFDNAFLPGELHLATPTIACVHDRRRTGRQTAVLLRKRAKGGPLELGATPCLGRDDAPPAPATGDAVLQAGARAAGLAEWSAVAAPGGFLVLATKLSQRLWFVEASR